MSCAVLPPPLDTVKLDDEVAVPLAVVTLIGPVVAPEGTVVLICVLLLTVKLADVPLNLTAVAPVKFVPVTVTLVPTAPEVGLKLEIVGAPPPLVVTVKLDEEVAVPLGVVTLIGPVVAPEGTVAVMLVLLPTVKLADVPLNLTAVAPVKLVPVIVTLVPTAPEVGLKLEIVGALLTVP